MKRAQDLEIGGVAALAHEGLVDQALGHDDMGQRVEDATFVPGSSGR